MILPVIVFTLLGVLVLNSLLVFKLSSRAIQSAENAHERSNAYNKDLLDRLMALDFNTYKVYEAERDPPQTGYTPPEFPPEEPVADTRFSGFGSSLGLRGLSGLGDDDAA